MNIPPRSSKPRILVAPLDWGLGHAARCIPVIHTLQKQGADVLLAAAGPSAFLLQTEFPELPLLSLPGYGITYGNTRWGTFAALVRQLPKLLHAIKREEVWLRETVDRDKIQAVLSDNRYGLHHPGIPSIFVTHQLQIKTPLYLTDGLLQKQTYQYIEKFNACWIPDYSEAPNLAGALSHPMRFPKVPVRYISPLARFALSEPVLTHYLLILLSGPEPQRSLLEERLLQQTKLFQTPILFVRGLPGHTGLPPVPYHVTIVNHLPAATLQKAIEAAQFVVGRCGYSTVMEMLALQKKCIFVPTPMQTEQEYLARHLMNQQWALCLPQKKFQLKQAVSLAETFPYEFPAVEKSGALQEAVQGLLQQL